MDDIVAVALGVVDTVVEIVTVRVTDAVVVGVTAAVALGSIDDDIVGVNPLVALVEARWETVAAAVEEKDAIGDKLFEVVALLDVVADADCVALPLDVSEGLPESVEVSELEDDSVAVSVLVEVDVKDGEHDEEIDDEDEPDKVDDTEAKTEAEAVRVAGTEPEAVALVVATVEVVGKTVGDVVAEKELLIDAVIVDVRVELRVFVPQGVLEKEGVIVCENDSERDIETVMLTEAVKLVDKLVDTLSVRLGDIDELDQKLHPCEFIQSPEGMKRGIQDRRVRVNAVDHKNIAVNIY